MLNNYGTLISTAAAVGAAGDLSLQIITKIFADKSGWGLNIYFKQHGFMESLFIAGGMMSIFYMIYIYILKIKVAVTYLAAYGVMWDILFRIFRIFHSLDGYYSYLGVILSGFWGAVPMILPYIIYSLSVSNPIIWY